MKIFQRNLPLSFLLFLCVIFLCPSAFAVSNPDALTDLALMGESISTGKSELRARSSLFGRGERLSADHADHRATVYEVKGRVRIASQADPAWKTVSEGQAIQEGDILLTDKDSYVSVSFDDAYQNVTHFPANTRAVFRSIEPTEIFLEDGTLYNIFDELPRGAEWKVTTPTAVAAVRGTWWLVQFLAASEQFAAGTIQVQDDGVKSLVQLTDILQGGALGDKVQIPEGQQMSLDQQAVPHKNALSPLDPQWLIQMADFLERLAALRAQKGGGWLPPTGEEFIEPPATDPQSLGLYQNVPPQLDPVEDILRNVPAPESTDSSSSSSSSSPSDDFEGPSDGFEDPSDNFGNRNSEDE